MQNTDTLIGIGVMMVAGEMALTQVAKAIFPAPDADRTFGELARRLLYRLLRTVKKQGSAAVREEIRFRKHPRQGLQLRPLSWVRLLQALGIRPTRN